MSDTSHPRPHARRYYAFGPPDALWANPALLVRFARWWLQQPDTVRRLCKQTKVVEELQAMAEASQRYKVGCCGRQVYKDEACREHTRRMSHRIAH